MAGSDKQTIQQQAEEITRLREELEKIKGGAEFAMPLPHTLRKGFGDIHRGHRTKVDEKTGMNVLRQERPDNVPSVEKAPIVAGPGVPSNQDVLEAMAARAIAEAQSEE